LQNQGGRHEKNKEDNLQIKIAHLAQGIVLHKLVGIVSDEDAVHILKHHKLIHRLVVHAIQLHRVKQRIRVNDNHKKEAEEILEIC